MLRRHTYHVNNMIRYFLILLIAATFLAPARGVEKPNVILIYTDDQGSVDVNCYGAKDLVTPHMDDLAK